jgi:hypothetical protein
MVIKREEAVSAININKLEGMLWGIRKALTPTTNKGSRLFEVISLVWSEFYLKQYK